MPLSVLTIGTVNHAAGVRVTLDSFREHHPGSRLFTCLVDGRPEHRRALGLPGEVFSIEDMELPGGRRFAFKFTPFELCCALKPFAASYVLEKYGVQDLVYLDSDVMVFSPMDEALTAAWASAKVLCTPHFVEWPNEPVEILRQVRQYGTYNAGFFGVQDSPQTRRFLTWWGALCSEMGIFELAAGCFVDQIWLDLVVAERYGLAPLLDPGMNVGYWNLSERALAKDGLVWLVNRRERLKFFHFSGFDPKRLTVRRTFELGDVHVALAQEYAERLEAAGLARLKNLPYGLGTYEDGSPIPLLHRRAIFRNEPTLASVIDPFKATQDREIWHALLRAGRDDTANIPQGRRLARRICDRVVRPLRRLLARSRDVTR